MRIDHPRRGFNVPAALGKRRRNAIERQAGSEASQDKTGQRAGSAKHDSCAYTRHEVGERYCGTRVSQRVLRDELRTRSEIGLGMAREHLFVDVRKADRAKRLG